MTLLFFFAHLFYCLLCLEAYLFLQNQEDANKTQNRLYYAFFAVGAVIVLFAVFYIIGKRKKQQNKTK